MCITQLALDSIFKATKIPLLLFIWFILTFIWISVGTVVFYLASAGRIVALVPWVCNHKFEESSGSHCWLGNNARHLTLPTPLIIFSNSCPFVEFFNATVMKQLGNNVWSSLLWQCLSPVWPQNCRPLLNIACGHQGPYLSDRKKKAFNFLSVGVCSFETLAGDLKYPKTLISRGSVKRKHWLENLIKNVCKCLLVSFYLLQKWSFTLHWQIKILSKIS